MTNSSSFSCSSLSTNSHSRITTERVAAELDTLRAAQHQEQKPRPLMPYSCRTMIRQLPGNSSCMDCGAPHPDWACVSYGSLVCLQCSGRHRSYGVHISVVRSVDLDDWQPHEILKMLEGGNAQLRVFFERHEMPHTMIIMNGNRNSSSRNSSSRYHTKAALYYRSQMNLHVTTLAAQGTWQGREASRRSRKQPPEHQSSSSSSSLTTKSSPQATKNDNNNNVSPVRSLPRRPMTCCRRGAINNNDRSQQ